MTCGRRVSLEFCFLQLSTRRRVTFAIRDAHHPRHNKMPFAATDFEFKQRFWMFWLVMAAGFATYFLQAYLRKRPTTVGDRS
jgi:hypothetical protein